MAADSGQGRMIDRSVTALSGVGPARQKALARLGILTVGDMLRCAPRAYQNRGDTVTVADIKRRLDEGENGPFSSVLAVATDPQVKMVRRGMVLLKTRLFDETGSVGVTFFNQPYLKTKLTVGRTFRVFGRFKRERSVLTVTSPVLEEYDETKPLPGIVPVYPLTSGLTQRIMSSLVTEAMRLAGQELVEFLPEDIRAELSLPTYAYTLGQIHRPESLSTLETARRRLVFNELLCLFVSLTRNSAAQKRKNTLRLPATDMGPFMRALPFAMTGAQSRSVSEIIGDMSGPHLMNRILTGDVGSGKTAVAEAAAYAVVRNGCRVAVMAPTEILATQHADDFAALFEPMGIRCALLTGSTKKAERTRILQALRGDGDIDVVIGTHALLTEDVVIDRLGLSIIDEQHRFGVLQRAALFEKTEDVHCLVMSATPIPRTLTLAAYGSIDVSKLDELPAGRRPIDSFLVDSTYRARLNAFIRKQAEAGHQTYVVCPAVEEAEKEPEDAEELSSFTLEEGAPQDAVPPLVAAEQQAETLAEALPDLKIGLVHGRMKPAEKDAVMRAFADGETDVLVSTTVIEVGVNVPNATLMIVENAERFGLAQLHQLRGRVGRGQEKSYFIMVTDVKKLDVQDRLQTVRRTRDGFEIAEYDLAMRGPGDFFHESGVIRQSGQMELRLASACRDRTLIERASFWARRITGEDPELTRPEHRELARHITVLTGQSTAIRN